MIGKALYWLLLICTIPTMIWGCFKIGGPLFIFVGIILTFSVFVFVGGIVVRVIGYLLE